MTVRIYIFCGGCVKKYDVFAKKKYIIIIRIITRTKGEKVIYQTSCRMPDDDHHFNVLYCVYTLNNDDTYILLLIVLGNYK